MQAIILKRYNDFKLYNGETTTERIERLLKKHNISYNIYDKFPSFIQSPSMIIENNIVFDEQTLIENKTKDMTFNLYDLNKTDSYRISTDSYDNIFIAKINENNKDEINKELRIHDLVNQTIIETDNYYEILKNNIKPNEYVFIVSSKSMTQNIVSKISLITRNYIVFNNYNPNPTYEDIKKGLELFKMSRANTIIAIGGGSTIDTAKCIKAFTKINNEEDIINKNYKYSDTKIIAIPTTSGTGSESTEVAIMYYNGEKLSVDHPSGLPDIAILDYTLLTSLPDYQKKSVMLDTLCQSIEAFWSKNRTYLSKQYSKHSIELILKNYKGYLENNPTSLRNIQLASNLSGKAITLAKTCAPHAMCYRMTTKYNIAHGHAVTLTLINHWKMINARKDPNTYLMLLELANVIGFNNIDQSIIHISNIIDEMNLQKPNITEEDIGYLVDGVDMKRLYNHPIELTKDDIKNIYSSII